MKPSPTHILKLKKNEIFVFGSNTAGIHGAGAAKTARKWGAKIGIGFGLSGKTFAIPTCDSNFGPLSLKDIQKYITRFHYFVAGLPEYNFLVTEIGCGLAHFQPSQIAPLFVGFDRLPNVFLPQRFIDILESKK